MPPNLIIRDETPADIAAISDVTVAAFATLEISGHTEHFIVAALRAAGALTLSLVAELDGRVVGHIAFSPVVMSDDTPDWYALGPVSVLPEYQRQGIGKALVEAGLARLKALRGRGCCLVGHPDYYRRFGFRNGSAKMAKMGQKWGQTRFPLHVTASRAREPVGATALPQRQGLVRHRRRRQARGAGAGNIKRGQTTIYLR